MEGREEEERERVERESEREEREGLLEPQHYKLYRHKACKSTVPLFNNCDILK